MWKYPLESDEIMKTTNVDQLLSSMDHPQIGLIDQIRDIIKQAAPILSEGVKWNAPSYSLNGNDIITFNFRSYGSVSLIFHTGPKGKDTKTGKVLFEETSGIIQWLADKRFVLKIDDTGQLQTCSEDIARLVRRWVDFGMNNFEASA